MQISRLLQENKTLLRFGITFEFPDARIRTHERLKQNFDDRMSFFCILNQETANDINDL